MDMRTINKKIGELLSIRTDLTSSYISKNIGELWIKSTRTWLEILNFNIELAKKNQPLEWENKMNNKSIALKDIYTVSHRKNNKIGFIIRFENDRCHGIDFDKGDKPKEVIRCFKELIQQLENDIYLEEK